MIQQLDISCLQLKTSFLFKGDKFHGEGVYKWYEGEEYEGKWFDRERNGKGIFRKVDGTVEYSMYKNGSNVEDCVSWNPDRTTAHQVKDGEKQLEMLPREAEKFATNLHIPPVAKVAPAPVILTNKSIGFFARFFNTGPRFDENGRLMDKDNRGVLRVERWMVAIRERARVP
jgi:hypothetical protein